MRCWGEPVAREVATPGDDRVETRAYAVKRYLFRLGHAQRSARSATSIEQLVVGLAPVIGWGAVPRERSERARFVRAHRKSVQRWLDDLQVAGVVAHEPERDGQGMWWRTQIVLLGAPAASEPELRVARRRAHRWRARERARRRTRRVAPSLGAIRARSGTPAPSTRARIAKARTAATQRARRVALVEVQIAAAAQLRTVCRDLTHPFGAPPTSAPVLVAAGRLRSSATAQTGVPAAQGPAVRQPATTLTAPKAGNEGIGLDSLKDFDALVARRLAAREQRYQRRNTVIGAQASARSAEVLTWSPGHACPLGRLREAWVENRYWLAMVCESGTALAGPATAAVRELVARAIALYETHAEQRPAGWPASGAGALCVLARQQRAERFAGDVARLLGLAKGMRALAREHDPQRVKRARLRVQRRQSASAQRFQFRLLAARRESAEGRRRRVRDAVLLAGADPAAWPNAELALRFVPELRDAVSPRASARCISAVQ